MYICRISYIRPTIGISGLLDAWDITVLQMRPNTKTKNKNNTHTHTQKSQAIKKKLDQTKIPRPYVRADESRFLKRYILEPKKTIKRLEIYPKS